MKKLIVVLLVVAFFAAQAVAFAEDVNANVQPAADDDMFVEDTIEADDVITPEGDEAVMVEETEDVVPADQM